jgi:hypothetical protein
MIDIESTEAWQAFIEMRRAKGKRAPFTDLARKRILFELRRFEADKQDPEEILWQSVTNGWSGVFAIKRNGWQPHDKTTTVAGSTDYEKSQKWLRESEQQRANALKSRGPIRRVS